MDEEVFKELFKQIDRNKPLVARQMHIGYYNTAEAYRKLYENTKNASYAGQAIQYYTNAITAEDKTTMVPICYAQRSKLYVSVGETELAVQDMMQVQKLPSTTIIGIYAASTLRDISRLSHIQDNIRELKEAGKIDPILANLLTQHADITASNTLQLGSQDERITRLEGILEDYETFRRDGKLKNEQIVALQSELEVLKKQTAENTSVIATQEHMLSASGVKEKAEIENRIHKLEEDHSGPEHLNYYHTFYWTTFNLFETYRILSTELVAGDPTNEASAREKAIKKVGNLTLKLGAMAAQAIPIAGGIVSGIIGEVDKGIDSIYDKVMETRLSNKTTAICEIIRHKFNLAEEISICISKIALDMVEARKGEIDTLPIAEHKEGGRLHSIKQWVQKKAHDIKQKILPSVEPHDINNHEVKIALQDVILLMSHLCINYEAIIGNRDSLDEQCKHSLGSLASLSALPAPSDAEAKSDDTVAVGGAGSDAASGVSLHAADVEDSDSRLEIVESAAEAIEAAVDVIGEVLGHG